jgi:hypothetical protein
MIRQLYNKVNKINKINNINKRFCHHHYSSNVKMTNDDYYNKVGFEFAMKTEIDKLKCQKDLFQYEINDLKEKLVTTRVVLFFNLLCTFFIH